ncbi:MAG TPA: zf-HC2 domain-containing protein [Phycisphaerae bacterium]|jgi:anti-sigma-K factor RskA|nr:zf-HC2 domain-containing protein [Phycisphaerae bacterium]
MTQEHAAVGTAPATPGTEANEERWKMLREKLDDYLDGALSTADRTEVEAALARDAKAAKLLTAMRSERALRSAAYDTYMPTAHEAHALASQVMAEAYSTPAGRIGLWIRRGAMVAASIVIVACAFIAGRGSAPTKNVTVYVPETRVVYNVVYTDPTGDQMVREFASADDRDAFVKQLDQQGASGIVVAELTVPNHF